MAAGSCGATAGGAALPAQQPYWTTKGAAWSGSVTAWPTQHTARAGGYHIICMHILFGCVVLLVVVYYMKT
jgi:hypothetical protein